MTRRPKACAIGKAGKGPTPESRQCLRHRIDLVIVSRRWKRRAFLDEVVHPGHAFGQVNIVGLDFTGNRVRARFLATLRFDGNDAGDFVLQCPDDRCPIGLVLHEFRVRLGPLREWG